MAGGRPKIELDKKQFESLCGLQCTMEEFCCFFGVTDKTLDRWCKDTYKMSFSGIFAIKRGSGKISLRRSQFRLAEKNAAMAIFLGQNYLGQRNYTSIADSITIDKESNGLIELLHQAAKGLSINEMDTAELETIGGDELVDETE